MSIPSQGRAITVQAHGGPAQLEFGSVATSAPAAGEALVRVAAIGVNFVDIHEREGQPPYQDRSFPFIPGSEGAGTIAQLGPGVDGLAEGDRVAWWLPRSGSYAEFVTIPAPHLVPVPDAVPLAVAAAALVQGLTAHYLTESSFAISPGDVAVVHAAAGGVGLLLTQMIRNRGGSVLATASSDEKRALARQAGAELATSYDRMVETALERTGGRGVAVVYDGVGQASFDDSLAALRERGTLVLYGAASGKVPPFDLQQLAARGSLHVTHPALRNHISSRAELLRRSAELFGAILAGTLKIHPPLPFPLEQARIAQERLAARRTVGKILLIP